MLLKFLLFLFFIYLLFRVINFFFKVASAVSGAKKQQEAFRNARGRGGFGPNSRQQQKRRPTNGNVDIDYVPEDQQNGKERSFRDFKGGEYVDYEELK
ncbi:MAG: DUF4834 family protein [Cyclobacteriaceae bacterium]